MATAINKKKMSKGDMIKWVITILAPLIIMAIPTTEIFTLQMKLFFASTLMGILCFAFEIVPQTAVALIMPLFWVFFNVAPATVVFQPWTQYIPWMMLSGLLMANVLESTGLLSRVACFCILKTGATYNGILIGLAAAGFLLTMFVGSVVVPMAALTYGICMALNLKMCKESAGIMLVGAMSCLLPNMAKFTAPVLMMGIGESVTGPLQLLGFFESWFVNAPLILFFVAMVVISAIIFKPDQPISGKEYFSSKLQEMGKMSIDEKKTAAVIALYFVFIVTGDIHHLSITWGMALLPLLMVLPGIGAGTQKDIQRVNYGFILFITACMGIGATAGSLGLGQIIASTLMPYIQGQGHYTFFAIEWVWLVACNFVMTPLAMEAAFTIPLATIGSTMGLNPMAVYYFMVSSVDQIIMPYEYALYMVSFAFGIIRLTDFMKIMGIKMVVNFIIAFALLLPWWNFIGFLYL